MVTITLNLPNSLYERLTAQAARSCRPVEEEATALLAIAFPTEADARAEAEALRQELARLDDEALWRAARSTMPPDQREELVDLNDDVATV